MLDAVLGPGAVTSGRQPVAATAVLDLRAGTVTLADRVVRVVLTVPREGEVGLVEDLLVDRAFAEVVGEATALASLGDLTAGTLDELRWQLGAAALARAAGAPADAVAQGLRDGARDPHRHLHVTDGVAWVQDPVADPRGPLAYDRVVWVVGPEIAALGWAERVDRVELLGRLRAVVVQGSDADADALRRHAPDVPVLLAPASDTEQVMRSLLDLARRAASPDDTVLLAVPGLA